MLENELDFVEKNFLNKLIIVEGIKDEEALRNFGISKVFNISGKSIFSIPEIIPNSDEIVILTDYDEPGEEKATLLGKLLTQNNFIINNYLRHKFKTIFKITKIEELSRISKFMEDFHSGKIIPIDDKIFNRSRILRRRGRGKT